MASFEGQVFLSLEVKFIYFFFHHCALNATSKKALPNPRTQVKVKIVQLCPALFDPMAYTVHGILQARRVGSHSLLSSRGASQPRDQTQVSRIAGGFFTSSATKEAQEYWSG